MLRSHPIGSRPTAKPRELRGPRKEVDEWAQLEQPAAPPQPEPAALDEWDRLRQGKPEAAPAQQQTATIVRKLPLPEYHWLSKNHRENIQSARRELNRLREYVQSLAPEDVLKVVIGTCRRLNYFVFEELLLHCFKEQGFQVIRNSDTGDDEIDGRLMRDGQLYLVQAKWYSGPIKAAHLREFESTIERYKAAGGYFVHCGRTKDKSWNVVRRPDSKIVLLSGMKLVDFFLGRERQSLSL